MNLNLSQGLWKLCLISLLLLLFTQSNIASAGDPDCEFCVGDQINKYYVHQEQALQACVNFTAGYGCVGPGFCHETYNIRDNQFFYTSVEPFEQGTFHFKRNCPPGEVLDINTGSCATDIPNKGANLGGPDLGGPDECSNPENKFDGNPINAATGNKFSQEIDLVSSSGLNFSRSYNSDGLSGSSQIGIAWNHTYQRNLYISPEAIIAIRPDGKQAHFYLSGATWINQQAGGEVITQLTN